MPNLDPLESVAVSGLVSASLIAALIPALVDTGVLSPRGAREIYENALLMNETHQGDDPTRTRALAYRLPRSAASR